MTAYKPTDRLRDVLADNSLLLPALSRFAISLGFGDSNVAEVCARHGVHAPTLLAVFNFISGKPFRPDDVSAGALTAYLRSAHVYFIDYVLPDIRRRLIEAVSLARLSDINIAILKFFDDYALEVRRHMDYEDCTVFGYVDSLLSERLSESDFSISDFRQKHRPITQKLKELKELLICHYTAETTRADMLNTLLFDIVVLERDLTNHCRLEDDLFIPAVERLERHVAVSEEPAASPAVCSELDENGDQQLTAREREIISCIASGMSNKEIADRLCLSVHTVATHRRNICAKLNIHSAAGIAVYALMHKLA